MARGRSSAALLYPFVKKKKEKISEQLIWLYSADSQLAVHCPEWTDCIQMEDEYLTAAQQRLEQGLQRVWTQLKVSQRSKSFPSRASGTVSCLSGFLCGFKQKLFNRSKVQPAGSELWRHSSDASCLMSGSCPGEIFMAPGRPKRKHEVPLKVTCH